MSYRHFIARLMGTAPFIVWLRITDEGSVPEMRIWSILLIKSDQKWCLHLSRSLFLYLRDLDPFLGGSGRPITTLSKCHESASSGSGKEIEIFLPQERKSNRHRSMPLPFTERHLDVLDSARQFKDFSEKGRYLTQTYGKILYINRNTGLTSYIFSNDIK